MQIFFISFPQVCKTIGFLLISALLFQETCSAILQIQFDSAQLNYPLPRIGQKINCESVNRQNVAEFPCILIDWESDSQGIRTWNSNGRTDSQLPFPLQIPRFPLSAPELLHIRCAGHIGCAGRQSEPIPLHGTTAPCPCSFKLGIRCRFAL